MENPILAMIPSGYNAADAKLYSILPSDGSGDFTVSVDADATRINKEGLIEGVALNQARLTYDPLNPECPSLLLEPTRTNNIRYSEDTTAADWTDPSNEWSSVSNTETSPSGELTADTIDLTASDNASLIRVTNMSLAAGVYAVSFWIKDLEGGLTSGTIDLGDEGTGDTTPSISTVSNQWVRVERIITITSTKTFVDIQLNFNGASNKVSIWGLQVELGSFKSSYVPTVSTIVTRTNDVCKDAGNAALFNVSKLSLFIDVNNFKTNTGSFSYIVLTDGQNSPINMIRLDYTQNSILIRSYDNGTIKLSYNITSVVPNQRNKVLLTFDNNEAKTYFNGVLKNTSTSITIPSGLDSLSFTNRTESGGYFQGEVHDARVYDRVLTEAEAIKLTT